MNEGHVEISDAYRTSRRNTSVLCGIGLAWSAAQFDIEKLSLPNIGEVTLGATSIPLIIGIMCVYTMFRSTLEYMMQPLDVRRASLPQVDYLVTIYLVRLTVIALATSQVARSLTSMLFILIAVVAALIFFFAASFFLLILIMPLRMWLLKRSGRRSVASAAIESTYYSFALSWLALALLIALIGYGVFNPFPLLGEAYRDITAVQLATFSFASLALLLSLYFDGKYLGMVFAYVPPIIERTYVENGRVIHSQEANPDHPDYEAIKTTTPPFKYSTIKHEGKTKEAPLKYRE